MADVTALKALEDVLGSALSTDPLRRAALDGARGVLEQAAAPTAADVDAYRTALLNAISADTEAALGVLTDLALSSTSFLTPLREAAKPFADLALRARQDLDLSLELGPAKVDLGALPVAVPKLPVIAHFPVSSLGLALEAGSLRASGAGYLRPKEQAAGGVLNADLGAVRVIVAALLGQDDASGALGLFALMRMDFRPAGIQLGLGFSLDSVGGLFGINRGADTDAIRRSLVDGTSMDALFGGDASSKASILTTLAALDRMFPASRGEVVVGPVMRLGWLNVGGNSLVRLDVGAILVLPSGRVVLPGRAVLEVAGPGVALVHLRADMLGEVDVAGKRIAIDAALVDSQVLGAFRIGGTAAAFLSWGDPAVVVLTVGGFYPNFDPRPAQIAPQRRISIDLSTPLPGLQLSAEGYVAATTGTLQLGGKVTAAYDIGVAAVRGSVGGDALIQLSPLWFKAGLYGSAAIEAFGEEVASVSCRADLTGPGPLTLEVSASTKIFFKRVGGTKHIVLSRASGVDRAPADALDLTVGRELGAPDNITTEGGTDGLVRLKVLEVTVPGPGQEERVPLVSPVGSVVWRQDQFPLDSLVEKADGRLLATQSEVRLIDTTGLTKVRTRLATSSFLDLTDSASLAVPPYLEHDTGLRVPVTTPHIANEEKQTTDYETYTLPATLPWASPFIAGSAGVLSRALRASIGSPRLQAGAEVVATEVVEEAWVVARDDGSASSTLSASAAVARSRFDAEAVVQPQAAFKWEAL